MLRKKEVIVVTCDVLLVIFWCCVAWLLPVPPHFFLGLSVDATQILQVILIIIVGPVSLWYYGFHKHKWLEHFAESMKDAEDEE